MAIPSTVLDSLLMMDDYERRLALDRIGRENNMTSEEVQAALDAHNSSPPQTLANQEFQPVGEKTTPSIPAQPAVVPKYISDTSNLRMRYNPTVGGAVKQKSVDQAILCPTCSAPLGIPSQRPILVTCPNCMTQTRFDN